MNAFSASLTLKSEDDTTRLAQNLAPRLCAGDVVLLDGPIGSGKSHFARALIRSRLGRNEDVPSPTFTLVQTYQDGGTEIWHCDLYRLTSPDEAVELGLLDAFNDAICLVEWPDRLADLAPKDALCITLTTIGQTDARRAKLTSGDARWATKLENIDGRP